MAWLPTLVHAQHIHRKAEISDKKWSVLHGTTVAQKDRQQSHKKRSQGIEGNIIICRVLAKTHNSII